MDAMRAKQLEEMEKNKLKNRALSSSQLDRIKKREEEMFNKKAAKIQGKHMEEKARAAKQEAYKQPTKQAESLKNKVSSKLHLETKALQDKKREKYDPKKDGPG